MEKKVTLAQKGGLVLQATSLSTPTPASAVAQEALAAAYKQFVGKLGDSSQLAANYAERRQSISMIEKRAVQLYKCVTAIKRGRPEQAARILGIHTRRDVNQDLRRGARKAGSRFLELHLGWEPLIKDIYNACDILQRPIPHLRVTGRGASSRPQYVFQTGGTGSGRYTIWYTDTAKCQLKADFYVDNPNLWLANQMGLINPASVLWELATLSFVVDWFVNVGDYLNSLTDFAGLKFIEPTTTYLTWRRREEFYPSTGRQTLGEAWRMNRNPGIATPGLMIRPFKGFSPIRGVTAISLLTQQLKTLR